MNTNEQSILKKGKVYLVGAGPGDPGLITLRGKFLLQRAEVVVYDYLANKKLLNYVPDSAQLIYAGKKGGGLHAYTQQGINQLLVDHASAGKMVYSYLGVAIADVDQEAAKSLGLDERAGVLVRSVIEGSPAQEAGLAERDVILEMDGKAVEDSNALRRMVAFTPPDTQVTLTVWREGERKEIEAKLKTLPTRN